jgi:hypothetical protein
LQKKLNPCSTLLLALVALSCVTTPRGPGAGSAKEAVYELRDGKILRSAVCPDGEVGMSGFVSHIHRQGEELYYLKGRGPGETPCCAGYRNFASGMSHEAAIPVPLQGKHLRRFLGGKGVIYLLSCQNEYGAAPCTLHRVDINTMKAKQVEGVRDIALFRGKPVLLTGSGGGMKVNNNGVTVPVTVGGEARFGVILEDRFITVTNGTDTEMLDLPLMKNIYAWPASGRFATAEDNNLLVESIDAGPIPGAPPRGRPSKPSAAD